MNAADRSLCLADRTPWALPESTLRALKTTLKAPTGLAPAGDAGKAPHLLEIVGGVAIVDVRGVLFQYASPYDRYFGVSSYEAISDALAHALGDQSARSILLVVDSPGGQAAGCDALAAEIRSAARRKPTMAFVPAQCTSAAYYLASATSEIVVAPSAALGSIGTMVLLYDDSEFMAKMGIREIPVVSSVSPKKWPDLKTDGGIASYQDLVDRLGEIFVADVAKYRGVTATAVKRDFGAGWIKVGADAVSVGMADRVGTLESVARQLAGGYRPSSRPVAHASTTPVGAAPADDREARRARTLKRMHIRPTPAAAPPADGREARRARTLRRMGK